MSNNPFGFRPDDADDPEGASGDTGSGGAGGSGSGPGLPGMPGMPGMPEGFPFNLAGPGGQPMDIGAALQQLGQLLSWQGGPVNWDLATQAARQTVAAQSDPSVGAGDREAMARGFALNRFEGYNNEPDIETPYGYLYAGRHDRCAEVVRAGMRYMYTTGRGGLPGNNDSGGLTSCYVWNAVGLYPVAGQPVYLIGSPIFDAASLQLGEKRFTVETVDNSAENLYVQRAALNGREIDRAYLGVEEVHAGGTLRLEMGHTPSGWARDKRPPSYRAG